MRQKILNSRQIRDILGLLKKQWDAELDKYHVFLEKDNRLWITNRDIENINMQKLRVETIGLYFGELYRGELRLGIEGSQIVGPLAKKNIVELDESEIRNYLRGEDIEMNVEVEGFVLVMNNNDFFGTARYKEGKIINYFPKVRRIKSVD